MYKYKNTGGNLGMADYFLQQVNFARLFRPNMDDIIIDAVLGYFPPEVER